MATTSSPTTDELFVALGHPLRRQILRLLMKGRDRELSPTDLAERMEEPLSKLSYHVRILLENGAIELVRTEQIRGSTQHFYRSALEARWARSALRSSDGS